MKTEIPIIHTAPTQTGNPVRDFQKVITDSGLAISYGKFYGFRGGAVLVTFYLHSGKEGMDHFRKILSKKDLYQKTRITTSGKRENHGTVWIDAELFTLQPSRPLTTEQLELFTA